MTAIGHPQQLAHGQLEVGDSPIGTAQVEHPGLRAVLFEMTEREEPEQKTLPPAAPSTEEKVVSLGNLERPFLERRDCEGFFAQTSASAAIASFAPSTSRTSAS